MCIDLFSFSEGSSADSTSTMLFLFSFSHKVRRKINPFAYQTVAVAATLLALLCGKLGEGTGSDVPAVEVLCE